MKFNVTGFLIGVIAGVCFGLALASLFAFHINIVDTLKLVGAGVACLFLTRNKELTQRDIIFFVCAGATMVFLFFVTTEALTSFDVEVSDGGVYTGWVFHKCYVKSLSAWECSATHIKTFKGKENQGYSYYPPVAHVIAKLIPLPWLMLLVFTGFAVVLTLDSKSFFTAPIVFFLALNLWFSFVRGCTLPFFLALFFALVLTAYWPRLNWPNRIGLVVLALLTHIYTGWFVAGVAIVFVLADKTGVCLDRRRFLFFVSLLAAFYFFSFFDNAIRVFLMPLLFAGLLLYDKDFLKNEVIK